MDQPNIYSECHNHALKLFSGGGILTLGNVSYDCPYIREVSTYMYIVCLYLEVFVLVILDVPINQSYNSQYTQICIKLMIYHTRVHLLSRIMLRLNS